MEGRRTPPSRPPNPALPYREDCWSEGETSVLIDAWGDRYVELNRGNLRQKQWQEVADAVNSRPCDARRPPRTDVQCKNRVDTLKKKYKAERSKIASASAGGGGGASPSQWIFYDRLEDLIGASVASAPRKKPPPPPTSPPLALPLPSHCKGYPLPTAALVEDSFYRRRYSPEEEEDGDSDSSFSRPSTLPLKRPRAPPPPPPLAFKERSSKVPRQAKEEDEGIRELSKVILRFGEIYEKVELEKHKQMMELEKQRIEFTKSLEIQRMQMFVDSQVELMKMERGKRGDRTGLKRMVARFTSVVDLENHNAYDVSKLETLEKIFGLWLDFLETSWRIAGHTGVVFLLTYWLLGSAICQHPVEI